ncbi:hypothetical protein [Pseudanabaena sp. PCC 6802]|uniref:hypothetical protein n=1 Tax=Pseudanabaena sp. PCC 6802 TaxID=118173 RepID=UPI0003459941|nr:hypothetical protein [Pseudanabaena sp. PCC 6802]
MKLFTRSSQTSNSESLDPLRSEQWKNYCDLELISTEASDRHSRLISKPHGILGAIQNLWEGLIDVLTKEPEIKVWQKQDRHGNTYWQAYDPWTGDTVSIASELEMRYWLESRYRR